MLEKIPPEPEIQQVQFPESIRKWILPLRDLVDEAVDKLELLILIQQQCGSLPVPEEWMLRAKLLKAQLRFSVSCLCAGGSGGGIT
jgi:hypothetical protein